MSDEIPPHCDPKVLHAPGTCVYCDQCPGLQFERIDKGIAFTNEPDDDHVRELTPCPAVALRPRETIELWPGNRPMPKEEMAYIAAEAIDLSTFGLRIPSFEFEVDNTWWGRFKRWVLNLVTPNFYDGGEIEEDEYDSYTFPDHPIMPYKPVVIEHMPTPRWVRLMWLTYYLCGLAAIGYLANLLWP